MWDFLVYSFRAVFRKSQNINSYDEKAPEVPDFNKLNYSYDNPVMNIPTLKLRLHGGQTFKPDENHFVRYYRDGIESLKRFFETHQPNNIFERHFIFDNIGSQQSLPWRYGEAEVTAKGEHGLSQEHGSSAYGPVSARKLVLETKRLNQCAQSIKKNGYVVKRDFPSQINGFPRGYFLVSNSNDWIFIVVGAKHRVAAMTWLGWKVIPVCFEPNFPRFIFECNISKWPRVASGEFTIEEAKLIFDSYF